MVSLLPMRRRLCRCCDDVVALVAMALLPLPMRRRLAVVDDDGDGATGDSIDDNCDSVTNVNNDGAHWPLPPIKAGLSPPRCFCYKIKSATLTLPSAQRRPLAHLHPTFPRNCCSTDIRSRTKIQSSSLSSMIAGPLQGPAQGGASPSHLPNPNPSAVPPKRADRLTPPSHCSCTEFPNRSIRGKICDSLPTHNGRLYAGCVQHILQARHSPCGMNVETLQLFYARRGRTKSTGSVC